MDEGYFLYFEDAEYCLRARRAGWRIRREPRAVAVHFRGGSGPVKSLARARQRLPAYYYSSRARFFYQAHGTAGLLAANGLWTLGRGLAALRRLAGRSGDNLRQREARDIWINALNPLGPRHAPGD
jgi:N-acetylglucosaminyl-diphospho-decaprenol L-rhamnosyltransferase